MGTCPTDRAAAKIMRLHHAPIHHLSVVGPYVVSGGGDGFVRFYDGMLRLVAWFEEFAAGPISCVSFSNERQQAEASRGSAVVNKYVSQAISGMRGPWHMAVTMHSTLVAIIVLGKYP